MQLFNQKQKNNKVRLLKEIPSSITFVNGSAFSNYSNNKQCKMGCIGCSNPKCMYFKQYEIECSQIQSFAIDNNKNVCPVGAITWNKEKNHPEIDKDKCVKCGLCMQRCPIGAIQYNGEFSINTELNDQEQKEENQTQENLNLFLEQETLLENIKKEGLLILENDEIVNEIVNKLEKIHPSLHNNVVRNLLIGLNCFSSSRRIGDVYTRMDAVYQSAKGTFGAVEVEFGSDTLDASRAILDDIAILHTRYNLKKEDNHPLVVCLKLPNERQGYWQVLKDIYNIENIKINTISIIGLMILLWNSKTFDNAEIEYYADFDNMTIRPIIEKHLERKINVSLRFLGILEPNK